MPCRPLWVAACLCLAISVALAQDPTKVAPTHYRLGFENEHVQVVYVHYGPHEKSPLHDHPGGVVVNLSGGHLKFTDQHGKTQEVNADPGEARWFPPFKHKVENLGDMPYNAVYIGIKPAAGQSAAKHPAGDMDEQTRQILAAYVRALQKP